MSDIVERVVKFIEDPKQSDNVFAQDLFCDINVPSWRFQMQGANDFIEWIKGHWGSGSKILQQNNYKFDNGFALDFDHEYNNRENQPMYARNLWLCKLTDGKISEVILFCPGEWDQATRQRQAAEAPMFRR